MSQSAVIAADQSLPLQPNRAAVAIIANAQTPYRLHLHRRIAREIPEIQLFSFFTHETSNAPWAYQDVREIGSELFGKGERTDDQSKPSFFAHEYHKAGQMIEFMKSHGVRAVVQLGYNDPGRIRVIRWCRRHGIPLYLWGDSNIHGDLAKGMKAVVKRAIVRRVLKWCEGALACGSLGKAYFEKYGVRPDDIFFFPVEPDYDLVSAVSAEQVSATAARFGLANGRRRIIYSGRLVPAKRPELLIQAFIAIAADRPDWDLLMVGDGRLRDELKAMVPVELSSRVIWTGFIDDQVAVSALYRLSDVLVLPSDYEPWALVVNEAAAAGLAMVASEVVGAAAEMVVDGVNGWRFPVGDLSSLTTKLLDVTNAEKIDQYKAASFQVLADWRQRADPVDGLRKALRSSGVIRK